MLPHLESKVIKAEKKRKKPKEEEKPKPPKFQAFSGKSYKMT